MGVSSRSIDFYEKEDDFARQASTRSTIIHAAPSNLRSSNSILQALSDENSQLAKFLFIGCESPDDIEPINSMNALWYRLALEPLEIRNNRVLIFFECITIFGLFFISSAWAFYEWSLYRVPEYGLLLENILEVCFGVALSCSSALAFLGCAGWLLSTSLSSNHTNFVFESRGILCWMMYLLIICEMSVWLGILIGTYVKLNPLNNPSGHWISYGVTTGVVVAILLVSQRRFLTWAIHVAPLEGFHVLPIRMALAPTKRMKLELKRLAFERAKEIKSRVYKDRLTIDPLAQEITVERSSHDLGILLDKAAINLGLRDINTVKYEERLNAEFFFEANHLRGRDVEFLARYIPYRLAEEVHSLLKLEDAVR